MKKDFAFRIWKDFYKYKLWIKNSDRDSTLNNGKSIKTVLKNTNRLSV